MFRMENKQTAVVQNRMYICLSVPTMLLAQHSSLKVIWIASIIESKRVDVRISRDQRFPASMERKTFRDTELILGCETLLNAE
jgi:hypothetical protein